jgi:hypothetical protein
MYIERKKSELNFIETTLSYIAINSFVREYVLRMLK